ncbi:Gfo/Idh/MocA family oxidoreductase [Bacillus sp. AGMB 02131]|uniref:Gfo/Idh/MocA family oxidoreductase n=1 Tax=Peribacillus faecalis TaxID=2772559 RepID=A0A927HAH4_9BACI|nr:Gfo/Idh/MocA family oxidoreductase [Peribacillus faecalis]MBD3108680.1 Gfo/Idh/MocA family oxidoreductase [Peribacillus faecalis]
MKKVKWGILSTASIAKSVLIPAIKRAENAEGVAIASRGERVHRAAAECGIPVAYESYDALLQDANIDAVYIPLPNHLHKEWVIKAAEHGKHVLCEKPVALSSEEALEMVRVCKEQKVVFMEAFMYQFHPQYKRVQELMASGEIGDIKLVKGSFSFFMENREGNIRMNKEMGGGSLFDVGSYCVHAIRSILNAEPVQVYAQAQLDLETKVDTSAYVSMDFENGIKATFDCSFDMLMRNELEIIGTQGAIKLPHAYRPDINDGIGEIIIQTNESTRIEKMAGDIYKAEVEHISAAILQGTEPVYPGAESVKNMKVLQACLESIETGEVVQVK